MTPSSQGSTIPGVIVTCKNCAKRNRVPTVAPGVPRCASCHQSLPWLIEADDQSFDAMARGRLPVLVDLWAPWCGPCRLVTPAVEQAAIEFAGRLKVVKVNVDLAPAVAQRLGVQGVPTLIVMHDGHEVARQVGALPAVALTNWLREAVQKARA